MSYQIALFIHLIALVAAATASGIVHFAAARRGSAPTLRHALEWGGVMGKAARVFPIAVLTLIASGGYMVAGRWSWTLGWVQAGLAGAVALLVIGAVLGKRGAGAARATVARLQQAGRELPNDGAPDRLASTLSDGNTGLALAIVLAMTIKLGLAGSLAILAIGWAAGAYLGFSHARAKAPAAEIRSAEAA